MTKQTDTKSTKSDIFKAIQNEVFIISSRAFMGLHIVHRPKIEQKRPKHPITSESYSEQPFLISSKRQQPKANQSKL